MITLDAKLLEELLCDPRMAASVLMGWELDDFQSAALKMDWWFPWTIDSSGTGTGKTLRVFIHSCLRAMLIEDQWVGCYFPTWGGVGQQEFWPYFYQTMGRSQMFRDQLRVHRRKIGETKGASCWTMHFKDGSKIEMPAPNFLQDARTQAGRSFNTLHIDECWKIYEMGKGIDQQLIERARRPAWNKHHPIHGNHVHLHGHAQKPSHKGYERVRGMRKMIKEGSVRHAMYSFCYKDFTPEFARKVVNEEIVKTQKASIPRDDFARQILGLWARDGATFYPEDVLKRGQGQHIGPLEGRLGDEDKYVLGFDIAPGQSIKADFAAGVVLRLRKVSEIELPVRMTMPGPRLIRCGSEAWEVSVVWAWSGRNYGADELAAFIHQWHERFGFAAIVMDNGGGGQWVKKALLKDHIEVGGTTKSVRPICTLEETTYADKQPILRMFKRGGSLDEYVDKAFLTGDEGFLAYWHMRYRERLERRELGRPVLRDHNVEFGVWTPAQQEIALRVEEGFKQLEKIRQALDKEGKPLISGRGFTLFVSSSKKDIAMAGLYAETALYEVLSKMNVIDDGEVVAAVG